MNHYFRTYALYVAVGAAAVVVALPLDYLLFVTLAGHPGAFLIVLPAAAASAVVPLAVFALLLEICEDLRGRRATATNHGQTS